MEQFEMEKRQLGKTDMHVSALGYGGAKIGFEKATPETVSRLLGEALDAGLNHMEPENAAAIALRFTLSVPGVHTAIVGTANRTRWRQNAALLAAGALDDARIASIRARWKAVAGADWVGQI